MHLSASSISSVGLCVAVRMELLHGISGHTTPQSFRLPQDISFVLLPVISLLCRLNDWVYTDVGLSLLLARWHGTHCRDICVILFTPYLFLDNYLRHFFWSTNVCRALEAFCVDALYKFTFYLFIYSHPDLSARGPPGLQEWPKITAATVIPLKNAVYV